MKNFKIITVSLITAMATNITASNDTSLVNNYADDAVVQVQSSENAAVDAALQDAGLANDVAIQAATPEVKTVLPVVPALPVTAPVIVPSAPAINPVAKIDEVKPVESAQTSVVPAATPTIHPLDLLKTETIATPAAHENPVVAPVVAPINTLPATSPTVTAPAATHIEEVKPVAPAPVMPTPVVTAPVVAHVEEVKPVVPAPVVVNPTIPTPVVAAPVVAHAEEVKPAPMAIPATVDSEHVKIVKVYPVYDAVRLAVKNITNAAQDMVNYVYNFMTKPAPTKKEETPAPKEEVKAENVVVKTEEVKPVTPEIKA